MASFEDASRWVRVQFFLTLLGFGLLTVGMLMDTSVQYQTRWQNACSGVAFFLYLLTLALSFSWTFVDQARNCKGVCVCNIVFGLLAGIFSIVTASRFVHGSFHYIILFYTVAIAFVLFAAIFSIVEVAGDVKVKLPSLPTPRKSKKDKKEKDIEAGEEEGEKKEEVVELEDTPKEEKKEGEETTTGSEEKTEEGATNGHVVKEEEEKKEEEKEEEKKEEGEEKKEEAATKE